jgi:electron transport complex protein RnfG
MKKSLLQYFLTLFIAAILLAGLTFGLQGIANTNAQKQHLKTMQTLLPGSESFTKEVYTGEDANIRAVHKGETGFVIETATQGYADEIVLLVGVSNEGTVTGLVVKDMHETIGLGANALTDWQFLAQFLKSEGDAQIGTNIDAITGATVTSKAIARCVNSAVSYVTGTDTDSGATSWGG